MVCSFLPFFFRTKEIHFIIESSWTNSENNLYLFLVQLENLGLDKIEFLQSHNIRDIYQKAFCIIEQYFSSEEEEDVRVAPSANNNQYQFNADQSVPMGGFQF